MLFNINRFILISCNKCDCFNCCYREKIFMPQSLLHCQPVQPQPAQHDSHAVASTCTSSSSAQIDSPVIKSFISESTSAPAAFLQNFNEPSFHCSNVNAYENELDDQVLINSCNDDSASAQTVSSRDQFDMTGVEKSFSLMSTGKNNNDKIDSQHVTLVNEFRRSTVATENQVLMGRQEELSNCQKDPDELKHARQGYLHSSVQSANVQNSSIGQLPTILSTFQISQSVSTVQVSSTVSTDQMSPAASTSQSEAKFQQLPAGFAVHLNNTAVLPVSIVDHHFQVTSDSQSQVSQVPVQMKAPRARGRGRLVNRPGNSINPGTNIVSTINDNFSANDKPVVPDVVTNNVVTCVGQFENANTEPDSSGLHKPNDVGESWANSKLCTHLGQRSLDSLDHSQGGEGSCLKGECHTQSNEAYILNSISRSVPSMSVMTDKRLAQEVSDTLYLKTIEVFTI